MLPEIVRELATHQGMGRLGVLDVSRDRDGDRLRCACGERRWPSSYTNRGADDKTVDAAGDATLHHPVIAKEESVQRGSDKHGARQDDALARDVEGMIRGTGPTHAEEWKDPEPPADDDPQLTTREPMVDRGERPS